jgi:hypothetical protein
MVDVWRWRLLLDIHELFAVPVDDVHTISSVLIYHWCFD